MDTIKLTVYGNIVEVRYVGFVADFKPGDDPGPGGITNDVWMADDGRKFVEVYITGSWREYDASLDGPIWTEEEWKIGFCLNNGNEMESATDLAYRAWIFKVEAPANTDHEFYVNYVYESMLKEAEQEMDDFAFDLECGDPAEEFENDYPWKEVFADD